MLPATNMIITTIPTSVPNGPARLQPHPPPKVPETTPMYTANGTDAAVPTMEPILAARLNLDQNFTSVPPFALVCGGAADAHAVERTVDEGEGNGEEGRGEDVRQVGALRGSHAHGKLNGQKAK